MGEKIAIYGASGHGKVVAEIAKASGFEVVCFIDDAKTGVFFGLPILSFDEFLKSEFLTASIALGIGCNNARAKVFAKLKSSSLTVVTLIHPSAILSKSATICEGSVIMAGAIVNAEARIGDGVILNSGCIVEHDCIIGDFAHISPNASLAGAANIGEYSHIGIGASIIQGVTIGRNCIIGAGAAVISDTLDGSTAVGVPAKDIKYAQICELC